jgi:hypothetical protein
MSSRNCDCLLLPAGVARLLLACVRQNIDNYIGKLHARITLSTCICRHTSDPVFQSENELTIFIALAEFRELIISQACELQMSTSAVWIHDRGRPGTREMKTVYSLT